MKKYLLTDRNLKTLPEKDVNVNVRTFVIQLKGNINSVIL